MKNLIKILPLHIFLWGGIGVWLILKRRIGEGLLVFKGIFWNIFNLRSLAKKRAIIQRKRTISDRELFPKIMKRKPINYFYQKLSSVEKIGKAEGWNRP